MIQKDKEIELKPLRNNSEPCTTVISVAVSRTTKLKAEAIKVNYKIDLNQMIREYIEDIFAKAKGSIKPT